MHTCEIDKIDSTTCGEAIDISACRPGRQVNSDDTPDVIDFINPRRMRERYGS